MLILLILEVFLVGVLINPLMPGVHKKVTHT